MLYFFFFFSSLSKWGWLCFTWINPFKHCTWFVLVCLLHKCQAPSALWSRCIFACHLSLAEYCVGPPGISLNSLTDDCSQTLDFCQNPGLEGQCPGFPTSLPLKLLSVQTHLIQVIDRWISKLCFMALKAWTWFNFDMVSWFRFEFVVIQICFKMPPLRWSLSF